ncbi:MAG: aminotransferase class I/II-fold pyridoxal phosphate-dependent enzyme [Bacilli bacterium]
MKKTGYGEQSLAIHKLQRARDVLAGKDIHESTSEYHQFHPDVISFADGEGMRRAHPEVILAGLEAILETEVTSLEKYFFLKRFEPLDDAIQQRFLAEGLLPTLATQLCISSGTSHLFHAIFASVDVQDTVVLTPPGFYHSLANWCKWHKSSLACISTSVDHQFKLTSADLLRWLDGNKTPAKVLVLFNPTYTGAVYTQDELADLASIIHSRGLIVIEDCLFMDTVYDDDKKVPHLGELELMKNHVVTLHGVSKAYGLANIRIGWACGPQSLITKMNEYVGATLVDPPHVCKAMALEAITMEDSYLERNRHVLKERKNVILNCVQQMNRIIHATVNGLANDDKIAICYEPESGHSILLSFNFLKGMRTELGFFIEDSIDVVRYFLHQGRVALSPGLSMGFDDCTVRISYGCVGLSEMYPSAIVAERMILEQFLSSNHRVDNWSKADILAKYEQHQSESLLEGNKVLEDGLMNRLLPTLVGLLKYNNVQIVTS